MNFISLVAVLAITTQVTEPLWAATVETPTAFCKSVQMAVSLGKPAQRLDRFLNIQWKYLMGESPEWATYVGYPGQNDRWTDQSFAAIARRKVEVKCQLQGLEKIKPFKLTAKDKVTLALVRHDLELLDESNAFGVEFLPINHMSGIQIDVVDVIAAMPTAKFSDYRDILMRLHKLPAALNEVKLLMREGSKRKITGAKVFLPLISAEIDALLLTQVEENPLYRPLKELPRHFTQKEQIGLREEAKITLEREVYPALRDLRDFINGEYSREARSSFNWSDLPNGRAWYAYTVKYNTTTQMKPDELHELGLSEVARISHEMSKIREELKFKGDAKAFGKFLLSDKRFYFESAEDLLAGYRDIAKRIDPELSKVFKTLPRLTYGVREMPPFRATSGSGAEYQGGSLEAGRPGWFQANTYDLKSRPKWAMETLTFHEGVPGHHLQISRAQELTDLPDYRKFGGNTAYTEGWALYAESLGEEMGFYKDPYSKYGHYSDEMLRAVRLVVDTGMHAKGWSREKALAYYRDRMPVSDIESQNEINRYAVWPGQALAYKVGQLKIRALRDHAQQALGEKFDVREFHDVVLGQGALPMDILENIVNDWIVETQKKKMKTKGA